MASRDELLTMALQQREMAVRVRGLARAISLNTDRDRMMQQANELEAEAAHLEGALDPLAWLPIAAGRAPGKGWAIASH
jgi:hypothetical protein